MAPGERFRPNAILPQGGFTRLLALMLGMLVLAPVLEAFLHLRVLEDVFLTAVFAYATYAFNRNRSLLIATAGLAVPAIALTWASQISGARWLAISGGLCDAAFIVTITVAMLIHIYRQKDVSADMIAGAIVVYLLMAVIWSQIYWVLESFRPGQFSIPAGYGQVTPALLRYFSLVTITTVGYGDITPLTDVARALANLESVVGQLYLVIQVAWLVGMHVTMRAK